MDLASLPSDKKKLCEEILNGKEAQYEKIKNKTLDIFLRENEIEHLELRGLLFDDQRKTGLMTCSLCEEQLKANFGHPWLSAGLKSEYNYKCMVD